jgi:hypothetical protein
MASYCREVLPAGCPAVAIAWTGVLFFLVWLAVMVGIFVQHARDRRRRKAVATRLSEREPLSPGEFGERFFGPGQRRVAIASALRELLEFEAKLALAGLRPDDCLEDILGCRASADPAFFLGVEEHLGVDTSVSVLPQYLERTRGIITFGELVDFVANCPPKESAT